MDYVPPSVVSFLQVKDHKTDISVQNVHSAQAPTYGTMNLV